MEEANAKEISWRPSLYLIYSARSHIRCIYIRYAPAGDVSEDTRCEIRREKGAYIYMYKKIRAAEKTHKKGLRAQR